MGGHILLVLKGRKYCWPKGGHAISIVPEFNQRGGGDQMTTTFYQDYSRLATKLHTSPANIINSPPLKEGTLFPIVCSAGFHATPEPNREDDSENMSSA
ncbi:hypothetical protein CEXT_149771 [Caerostris extrusa]|uniref:Uncharacterized protein n=1 Tax=Caerostris extrusa TaxID=172846 RepID=A0AAV4QW56_CAEEX|nr:hypothetical protein CEXT_149771 [Caerostris extrusa]